MNKMNRRIFNFFLLVMFFGIASSVSATTYRLQRVTSVENGQKYVFEQGGRVLDASISSNQLQTTTVYGLKGLSGAETYVWQLSYVTNKGYTIKKASQSLYLNNNSSNAINLENNSSHYWSFLPQVDGTMIIKSHDQSKFLGATSSKVSSYGCYDEARIYGYYPHSIVIYKLVEETKTSADLHFVNNCFVKFIKGESYSAPVLKTAEGFDGTITYSSSNTKVATVDASTGEVTIVGTGRALITASSAATTTYDAGEATYTLLVMGGDGTADKPYCVSDMNSGYLLPESYKYVSGYIVGYYTSNGVFKDQADDDQCMAIADERDGISSAEIALVELKTGTPRTNYGLKSHPDELGKRVKAYGRLYMLRKKTSVDFVESLSFADRYPVTISKYKYATYRTTEKLDFTGTGVLAYTAAIDGSSVKLTKISDGIVDTGLGVVLYSGTAGTYDIPVTTAAATVTNTGLLISDGTSATKEANTYVLGKKKDVVGFYRWIGAGSLPAGRAYLNGGASAARDYLEFAFDDEATGMRDAVHHDKVEIRTDVVYDLQGRRVAQPGKGLYIVNGKKIVIK